MDNEDTQNNQQENDRIIPAVIEDELKQDFLDYAMSVIVSRALPDVRDGLKPVHRRVLFTMMELGLDFGKPYKKCARIVGDCLGKWHPHGDSSVYDALVRLAQPWSMRYPLIQGQGNFGSIDGDSAAAMRYTEARLSKISDELLQDIQKDTVDKRENFDGSLEEPVILPSKIPSLLVNGSSGIAVGMATNIPPHNLKDVCRAVILNIENPETSIQELIDIIKGPDYPTGGLLCGQNGVIQAYNTGRGKSRLRARIELEEKKNRVSLIVNEIPYMVNKSMLLQDIASLVKRKIITDISELRDESDRDGMRIVITLKKDSNPEIVKNLLFKHTRLETSYGVQFLALVNNVPKTLNLKVMIEHHIEHRVDIITRRTQYDLRKAKARAHILDGLLIALQNIDQVIAKIKKSDNAEEAKNTLIQDYDLSEEQAKAILDMKLQKLAALEQQKIKDEHKELQNLIEKLEEILANRNNILNIIIKEQEELIEKYGDERKTDIIDYEEDIDIEDLIEEEDVVVTISHSGYIKRMQLEEYKQQHRGGKGIRGAETKEEDFLDHLFIANTHSYLLTFTNKGKVYWTKVYKIPETGRYSKGKAIVNLVGLDKDEKISTVIPVREFTDDHYLVFATKKGLVKKTSLKLYSRPRQGGIWAIKVMENDDVIDVIKTDGTQQIILATKEGMAVRFNETDVRPVSRHSQGVRGIKLKKKDDQVVGMVVAQPERTLLTITENGFGKRTLIADYRLINRGGSGVINIKTDHRNGGVVAIKSVMDEDELMFISVNGQVIRTSAKYVSVIGRNTKGVTLMRLNDSDKVADAAKIIG
ncbi:DNA gyrase subunit A [archaeon]|jgi:DNA gyrase subunit A|nr:DNA gyrase subunit A [archaeon]MBT4272959.1 DNA gyrase subunit A [archaeon]MBT4460950.1 DNA gyrase subunit A [archaeon]MBT5424232.1 DNA gyrase subunit A [archaeon]MBT6773687.1 DNA gyrase subunit A [archaeon]